MMCRAHAHRGTGVTRAALAGESYHQITPNNSRKSELPQMIRFTSGVARLRGEDVDMIGEENSDAALTPRVGCVYRPQFAPERLAAAAAAADRAGLDEWRPMKPPRRSVGERLNARGTKDPMASQCRYSVCRMPPMPFSPCVFSAVGHWGTLDRWAQPVPPSAAMDHNTPHRVRRPTRDHYDVIIVGSGMGGGTMAYALKDSGLSVLLIERGDYLPQEPQNWDARAVFVEGRYKNAEPWYSVDGSPVSPGHLLLRRREHQVLRWIPGPVPPRGFRRHPTS